MFYSLVKNRCLVKVAWLFMIMLNLVDNFRDFPLPVHQILIC